MGGNEHLSRMLLPQATWRGDGSHITEALFQDLPLLTVGDIGTGDEHAASLLGQGGQEGCEEREVVLERNLEGRLGPHSHTQLVEVSGRPERGKNGVGGL